MYRKRKTIGPVLITLLLVLILGAACTPSGGSEPTAEEPATGEPTSEAAETANDDPLAGSSWQLVEMGPEDNPVSPLPDTIVTAEFNNGQITGSTGCNSYFADYTAGADGSLELGEIGSTLIGCPEPLMTQENDFLAALATASGYNLEGDRLMIAYENGRLVFQTPIHVTDASLTGAVWALHTFIEGETATSLVADTTITAEFADGQVSGSAGCNIYFGSYELEGNNLTFGELGSTRMACTEPVMAQENRFLAAMAAVETFILAGDELTLIHPNGELLFAVQAAEPESAASDQTDAAEPRPVAEERTWEEAVEILNSGEVVAVLQTHSLDVTLELADGRRIHTVEPNIDDIFTAVEECGQPCEDIILATE